MISLIQYRHPADLLSTIDAPFLHVSPLSDCDNLSFTTKQIPKGQNSLRLDDNI